jgi:hypothetical protein
MKIGFTGTRKGMTQEQVKSVSVFFIRLKRFGRTVEEIHIGDCIGADANFYDLAVEFFPLAKKIGHIPKSDQYRAFLKYDEVKPADNFLERNRHIVNSSDCLLATPGESEEILRSGTWSTIRFARRRRKHTTILFPDGTITMAHNGQGTLVPYNDP